MTEKRNLHTGETKNNSRFYQVLITVVAAIGIVGGVWWIIAQNNRSPDAHVLLRLNNKGIGLLSTYEYGQAADAFARIIAIDPNWLPARVNLGIAMMNRDQKPEKLAEAAEVFRSVLKQDAKNPYAHYCLGIITEQQADFDAAEIHFQQVLKVDPHDKYSLWHLGTINQQRGKFKSALEYFRKSVDIDPNFSAGLYGVSQRLRDVNAKEADKFAARHKHLEKAAQQNPYKLIYHKMGKYATAIGIFPFENAVYDIGPLPLFAPTEKSMTQLAGGAKWATSADFGSGEIAELRRAVRKRFGGTVVVFDFNGDGRLDLFVLGAVNEGGNVRDLLLRNGGKGSFVDVTHDAGLADSRPSLGCCVADFDNDGYPDLLITGAGEQHLYRNSEKGNGRFFEDVTEKLDLGATASVCFGAMGIDLDQDSDLDIILSRFAKTPKEALNYLNNKGQEQKSDFAVILNTSAAPPNTEQKRFPLELAFRVDDKLSAIFRGPGAAVNLAAGDFDGDYDLDALTLADDAEPALVINDRLAQIHRIKFPVEIGTEKWNGAVVFNCNRDNRSDLLFLGAGIKPHFQINQPNGNESQPQKWFAKGALDSPPLLQALAVDIDLDGWMDIVGLTEKRQPILLHNDGKRLAGKVDVFGARDEFGNDLIAVQMFDADGDCHPDLLLWSEKNGLRLKKNLGNGNHALNVRILGHRYKGKQQRSNSDGFGAWIIAQTGPLWTARENTTFSAGLGHSRHPLLIGLGREKMAEVVRVRWPDNIWQAEMNVPHCEVYEFKQTNREPDSCPLLFTWNGERFVFVTDILGAGAMGEALPGGKFRKPRPEESIKIEADQLAPKDGQLVLVIAEPKDEITYLDQSELLVIDHPDRIRVYPDERFIASPTGPNQDLLVFDDRKRIFPDRVVNHKKQDVTAKLRQRDRITVDDFAKRSWLGYAEDHWIELDFGGKLAGIDAKSPLILCLAGWTSYPYPEAIWAADQAGVALQAPILQRRTKDGKWETILDELGFPAGLPRMITVDVTGKLTGTQCVLRIRSSMQVFWDQIFIAPLTERIAAKTKQYSSENIRVRRLAVSKARLNFRGFMQEFTPDGRQPTIYNYDRLERVAIPKITGRLTKTGDVTELLHQRDDCFVILGPGDETRMSFDASTLPPLNSGWQRSYVLKARGYSRSCGPFIAESGKVFPLPFHGMNNFPYGANERYPETAMHQEYIRRYLTRQIGP